MNRKASQIYLPDLEVYFNPNFVKKKSFPTGAGPGRGKKKATNEDVLSRWQAPGPEGFFNYLEDLSPQILKSNLRYSPFEPEPWQRVEIEKMLEVDKNGNRKHSLCLLCWSRRHSKSIINCLIALHLFCTQQNWLCLCLANKLDQVLSVNFKLLVDTIRHSPKLLKLIGEHNIYADRILFPAFNNQIMAVSNTMAGAFGQKVSCIIATEIHSSPDLRPFRAMLASLADTENSLCLIDTNTDTKGGPVEAIEKQAATDSTVFVSRIEYKNFEEFKKRAPAWINRDQVAQHKALLLPSEFARDWLNLRTEAANSLFSASTIKNCQADYKYPVEDVDSLLDHRSYVIGAGLDRAKSLIKSKTSDATVWTVVAKTVSLDGQPEFFVLNQKSFRLNTSKNIKATILEDHKRYNIKNAIFEWYETGDLAPFMGDVGISVELMSATPTLQNAVFPELHRICANGNLHFPKSMKTLISEMGTFVYEQTKNGLYRFSHSSQRFHDDRIFSLGYAVHAVRASILNLYQIGNIACKLKSSRRNLCFLFGGNLTLLCAESCESFQQCKMLFREYKKFQMDSELSIEEFYKNHVKHTGARISQAA